MKQNTVRMIFAGLLLLFGAGAGRAADIPPGQVSAAAGEGFVAGYFASWKRDVVDHTMIAYVHLTHIAHAFAWPDGEGNLVLPEGYLYPELNQEAHAHGVKILMSLGGWGNCEGFAPMAADPAKRAKFVRQAAEACRERDYDGLDIDWEFVETEAERESFTALIRELDAALKAMTPPRLLSMAAPAGAYYGRWIDFEALHPCFDFIGFMTYDFHGGWSDHSGHNAPLYACGDSCGSVDETFLYARSRGIPASKILLGIPFYGRSFDCSALGLPFQTSGEVSFTEVQSRLAKGWTSSRDFCARVPLLRSPAGGAIVSYEDVLSVRSKCRYALDEGAGGFIIWELSHDRWGGQSVLLEAVGDFFRHRRKLPRAGEDKESRNASCF